jgi:hypothetical protein
MFVLGLGDFYVFIYKKKVYIRCLVSIVQALLISGLHGLKYVAQATYLRIFIVFRQIINKQINKINIRNTYNHDYLVQS